MALMEVKNFYEILSGYFPHVETLGVPMIYI